MIQYEVGTFDILNLRPLFCKRHFQSPFLNKWKYPNFDWHFTETCSRIGSDDGLAPYMRQTYYLNQCGLFNGACIRPRWVENRLISFKCLFFFLNSSHSILMPPTMTQNRMVWMEITIIQPNNINRNIKVVQCSHGHVIGVAFFGAISVAWSVRAGQLAAGGVASVWRSWVRSPPGPR